MVPKMFEGANLPSFPDHDKHNEEAISYLRRYQTGDSIIDVFINTKEQN